MSREGLSLRAAARRNHVTPSAIFRWFPDSVVREGRRLVRVLPDTERFAMVAVTTRGVVVIETESSGDRELLGQHGQAVRRLLDPAIGDADPLRMMRGQHVAGYELETDPDEIEALWFMGELDFLEIYLSDSGDE
jgi:hypothetical protein